MPRGSGDSRASHRPCARVQSQGLLQPNQDTASGNWTPGFPGSSGGEQGHLVGTVCAVLNGCIYSNAHLIDRVVQGVIRFVPSRLFCSLGYSALYYTLFNKLVVHSILDLRDRSIVPVRP